MTKFIQLWEVARSPVEPAWPAVSGLSMSAPASPTSSLVRCWFERSCPQTTEDSVMRIWFAAFRLEPKISSVNGVCIGATRFSPFPFFSPAGPKTSNVPASTLKPEGDPQSEPS